MGKKWTKSIETFGRMEKALFIHGQIQIQQTQLDEQIEFLRVVMLPYMFGLLLFVSAN